MGQEQPGLLLSLSFSGTVWHLRRAVNWESGHLNAGQASLKLRVTWCYKAEESQATLRQTELYELLPAWVPVRW